MELFFPANAQHVISERHANFHKGPNFNPIFDVLGQGIFNSDTQKWKYQKMTALSYFSSTSFRGFYSRSLNEKLQTGLVPLLDRCCEEGSVVDLQDVFQRFNSDIIHKVLIGHDHNELSSDQPVEGLKNGIHAVEEAILLRHILPKPVWKLQRWLGIGKERKMAEAKEAIDEFFYRVLRRKKDEFVCDDCDDDPKDLLSFYMQRDYGTPNLGFESQDSFLRDTFFAFLLAGQDSMAAALSWFFWLLIDHPEVEARIRDELGEDIDDIYELQHPERMVYLHGAILEALRLHPSVPFNH